MVKWEKMSVITKFNFVRILGDNMEKEYDQKVQEVIEKYRLTLDKIDPIKVDRIICICLDERYKDWEKRKEKFKQAGLNNIEEFVVGNGSIENLNYNLIYDKDDYCKICCGYFQDQTVDYRSSHLIYTQKTIILDCINKNLDNVLLLEDDAIPSKYFIDVYPLILKKLNGLNWDLIYLGHVGGYNRSRVFYSDFLIKDSKPRYGWHGILINKNVFKTLLNSKFDRNIPMDCFCASNLWNSKNIYCAYPQVISEEPNFSVFTKKNVNKILQE